MFCRLQWRQSTETVGTEAVVLHSDDKIKNLVSQILALELQLAQRTEISANISRHSQTLEEKLQEVTSKFQEEQNFNLAITRDMTRQYKGDARRIDFEADTERKDNTGFDGRHESDERSVCDGCREERYSTAEQR